jgi:hypothetical protein
VNRLTHWIGDHIVVVVDDSTVDRTQEGPRGRFVLQIAENELQQAMMRVTLRLSQAEKESALVGSARPVTHIASRSGFQPVSATKRQFPSMLKQ